MSNPMFNNGLRILLVEDHPFQLRATQYLLERYGFTQLTATDSAEGALRQMPMAVQLFDFLLCDQCLPDLPGLELVEFARHRGMIKQAILLNSLTSAELDGLEKNSQQTQARPAGLLDKTVETIRTQKLVGTGITIKNRAQTTPAHNLTLENINFISSLKHNKNTTIPH